MCTQANEPLLAQALGLGSGMKELGIKKYDKVHIAASTR
jgi:hypothetical protein